MTSIPIVPANGFGETSVVQNRDVNAKPSMYDHVPDTCLLVHNTFMTIQGEGPLAGRPAFFIRLGGCNFGAKTQACLGCDTSFHFGASEVVSFSSLFGKYLADAVYPVTEDLHTYTQAASSGTPLPAIVITGGEPCLQKQLPDFVRYCKDRADVDIQIETNGSYASTALACLDAGALVVCSPKAVGGRYSKLLPIVLGTCSGLHYKFVVSSVESDPHYSLPAWATDYTAWREATPVWVSPATVYKRPYQGEVASAWDPTLVDHEATSANYAHAAKLALKHGLRVSVQMHSFLSLA